MHFSGACSEGGGSWGRRGLVGLVIIGYTQNKTFCTIIGICSLEKKCINYIVYCSQVYCLAAPPANLPKMCINKTAVRCIGVLGLHYSVYIVYCPVYIVQHTILQCHILIISGGRAVAPLRS